MESIGKFNTTPIHNSLESDKKDESKVRAINQETRHTQKYSDDKEKQNTTTLQRRGIESVKKWLLSIDSKKRTLEKKFNQLKDIYEKLISYKGCNLEEQEELLSGFILIRDEANDICDDILNMIAFVQKNELSLLKDTNGSFINSIDSEGNEAFVTRYIETVLLYSKELEDLGIGKNRLGITDAVRLKILYIQLDKIFKRKL